MNTDKFFVCDFFDILWTGGIRPIWVQKIGRKKLMRFTQFCLFIVEKLYKSNKTCKFHQFFMCNFWA